MINTVNNREAALDILMEINEKDQYLHIVLNEALRKYQYLEKQERSFISRLVRGTVERRITLDYVINQVSTVKVEKMKPLIRNLIRMSVYQMMYMEQIPVSAVCNEAVKLAKKRHFDSLKGYVNGVLRNISRKLPELVLPDDDSIRYSMPEPLVKLLKDAYGSEVFRLVADSFLKERSVSIITNRCRCTPAELKASLEAEGVSVEPAQYIDGAFVISGFNYLEQLDSFRSGMFQVQDISSMLEGVVADVKKGSHIIDVCAAPGGKSIYAALGLEGTGIVEARDLTQSKTAQIQENVSRLGISNITVSVRDASVCDEASIEAADILLADVPCSGIGIIGRKPDIKYNISGEKIDGICALQRQIIDVSCRYVKKGGVMIYSTCTLNPTENEENVKYITQQGFETEDITDLLPKKIFEDSRAVDSRLADKAYEDAKKGYVTLLPGVHECDGFFVARLRKKG